jgi:hypothetical protein
MGSQYVNLDALLLREDFEVPVVSPQVPSQLGSTLLLTELEEGKFFFAALRKPDFQRETSNWSPQHIVDFVKSFVEGDLIPSVILWQSPVSNNLFVIDGAHRLSALIGWVRDDYGDGNASRHFYENRIQPEQQEAAEQTRQLIRKQVGSYEDHKKAIQFPTTTDPHIVKQAKSLGVLALPLQWVRGDAKKAEQSFLRINQKPTSIDPTELEIIVNRNKPNAIAARAVIRAGSGHKFWNSFEEENSKQTEKLAKEIHKMFFDPPIRTPIKTIDLPMAGEGYSPAGLRTVYEFVNLVNESRTTKQVELLANDQEGTATVGFLKKCRRIAALISSNEPASLGLHPAVYFYGMTGGYVPSAFLATVQFVMRLQSENRLSDFVRIRKEFEELLVSKKHFINAIVSLKGSGFRASPWLYALLNCFFELLMVGDYNEANLNVKLEEIKLGNLTPTGLGVRGKGAFSTAAKTATFITEALESAPRCAECGARLHLEKATTVDHSVRKAEGGSSHSDNAQLMHPYCNSGIKEKRKSKKTKSSKPDA